MVQFCEAVVKEICLAGDRAKIDDIIYNSMELFRETKSQNETMYIINMIVMLRTSKIEVKNPQENDNLERAIEIFRKLNSQTP